MKAETHNDAKRKYFQFLTAMCKKRQKLLVQLPHIVLDIQHRAEQLRELTAVSELLVL